MKLDVTHYAVDAHGLVSRPYTLAHVSDMHNCKGGAVLDAIRAEKPDAVVISGDQMTEMGRGSVHAMDFLRTAAGEFPTFYGLGNHERFFGEKEFSEICRTGVHLLIREFTHFGDLVIGATETEHPEDGETTAFLDRFSRENGFRVLLSHRPEWYYPYLQQYDIPLVLSGHAHGGQIRLLGHPVFSPGQGLFPKLAQGMHDGRLIVSRGIGNHTIVPRIGNRPELCMIHIS